MRTRPSWRFWLVWAAASSLASAAGYVVGLIPAVVLVGIFVGASGGTGGGLIAVPAAAVAVGLTVGLIAGTVQSKLLPWEKQDKNRWFWQSVWGWTLGAGLGCVVSLIVGVLLAIPGERGPILPFGRLLLEIATPISGLVLGWALRSVPSTLPMRLPWWLAAHAVAVSGGWIGAPLLFGERSGGLFGIEGVICGAVWYGVVSAFIMLPVARRPPDVLATLPADVDPA